MASRAGFRLENRSGYDTDDLHALIARGLRATGTKVRGLRVVVVASPVRSRGCATVNGTRMVIAIASPNRFSLRRLARLIEHEAGHLRGLEHEKMDRQLLFSLGPTPAWAEGMRLRYRGRAQSQLAHLNGSQDTRISRS